MSRFDILFDLMMNFIDLMIKFEKDLSHYLKNINWHIQFNHT
jgi:hypothetical protein